MTYVFDLFPTRAARTVRTIVASTAAVAVLSGILAPELANAQIFAVATKGNMSPEGVPYLGLTRPIASDTASRVTFEGKIRLPTGGTRGIFTGDPLLPNDTTVALQKELVSSGGQLRRFTKVAVSNAGGEVFYNADVSGPEEGIYSNVGPTPTNAAISGTAVPLPGAGVLDEPSRPVAGSHPGLVFHSTIAGGLLLSGTDEKDEGIFECIGGDLDCSTGTGALLLLVLKGDPVPDRPGRQICSISPEVAASSWGIAFRAVTDDANCQTGSGALDPAQGIFRIQSGGVIETVALQDEQANPAPVTDTYDEFTSRPDIENDGIIAFLAGTTGTTTREIVYRCNPATCPAAPAQAFIEEGDTDDPMSPTVAFSRFENVRINDDADVVFFGRARGLNGAKTTRAIYAKRDSGAFERIAGKFDPEPGGGAFRRLFLPSMSPGGIIVWRAKVKPPAGPSTTGIYLFQ